MAEMFTTAPLVKKTVTEYDFVFTSGMMMPLTVDTLAGDKITFGTEYIQAYLAPKPTLNDPDKFLPAENITLFTKHVLSIQQREREVTDMTPEQQFEWKRTLQEATGTIQ